MTQHQIRLVSPRRLSTRRLSTVFATVVLVCGCTASQGTPTPAGSSGGSTTTGSGGVGPSGSGGTGFGGSAGVGSTVGGAGGGAPITGTGGSGATGGGIAGTGGSGGTPVVTGPCSATVNEVVVPRRLVRLTFGQIVNSIRVLVDPTIATTAVGIAQVGPANQRGFPPLTTVSEGGALTDQVWEKGDRIAEATGKYVADNLATIGTCGAAPTEACAQTFVLAFAERAYRRPLNATEKTSLGQVLTEVKAAGGTPKEQVQFGVNAVLETPQFLYRAELGTGPGAAGMDIALTPYELASQISYFLTDAPPDQMLLDAARTNTLATPAQLLTHINRLAATPASKTNLQAAIFAYFQLYNLDTVAIDTTKFPLFTTGMRNAMYSESERFLTSVLWTGKLNDLILSRTTFVNSDLARDVYKIGIPAGATTANFVSVELPADRAGILTQPGLLTARGRPDGTSVVGRGLLVNGTMMCAVNPDFPEVLGPAIKAIEMEQENMTERQKADYRADITSGRPCGACHRSFDPYGLVLDTFDVLGRSRTVDEMNRPIDTKVTLPPAAGGAMVANAADFAGQIAGNGKFATCMTRNMMNFALADGATQATDCSVQTVAKTFLAGTDQTFTGLIREIALSKTLGARKGGN